MDKTDFSLLVSPALTRIKAYVNPVSASIKIKNTTSKDINLRLQLRPFTSSPREDGSISYTNHLYGPDKSLLTKVKILDGESQISSLNLLPFEEKVLNLKLELGSKIESGDYYFSLLFISNSTASKLRTYSKVESAVASNFLLSVKPTEAKISEAKISSPVFLTHGPVAFEVFVTNGSRQLLDVGGNIFIKDMFGHTIGKVNLPDKYILASSSRYLGSENKSSISKGIVVLQDTRQTAIWDEKFLLGFYTARVEIREKETNQIRTSETKFVAIPTFLLIAIAILAFIIGGVYLKIKKKN